MRTQPMLLTTSILAVTLIASLACRTTEPLAYADSSSASERDLSGAWTYEGGDGSAQQRITLTLRRDHTYTKTLDATVNGVPYGGTHSGTWKAEGMTVRLSGDGNWPPYTHNLSTFQRVR